MISIILCAGFGSRLQPLTKNTPKALLDVAGRPVLDYLMPQLLEIGGMEAVHVVANAAFFGQFYSWQQRWQRQAAERGVTLHLYSDASLSEEKRLGSVGDLAFVLEALEEPKQTLLASDDTIVRFPLQPIAERFQAGDENLVLAFPETNHQLRQRLLVLEMDESDRVARFHEHPENPPSEFVSPILYFLQPAALAHVRPYLHRAGSVHDSLAAFMDYLAQTEPVRAIRVPDRAETRTWFDIETKYMYKRANEVLSEEPLLLEGLF